MFTKEVFATALVTVVLGTLVAYGLKKTNILQ